MADQLHFRLLRKKKSPSMKKEKEVLEEEVMKA